MSSWRKLIEELLSKMSKSGHGKPTPPPIVSPPVVSPPPPVVSPPPPIVSPPPPVVSPPPPTTGALGPGSAWTGVGGSGFVGGPPADPIRSTAKPRLRSWTPTHQRFADSNFLIGVYASAKGGLKEVVAYVEGSQQSVTAPTINSYVNVRGESNSEFGYWFPLDASKFVAVNTRGEIQVYFKAVPNDPTLQERVIGPITFYPRSVAFDWVHTFGAGGDYATLSDGMNALAAAYNGGTAECGHLQCVASGSYYLDNAITSNVNTSRGYTLIDCADGVSARLHRGEFDPNNTNDVWTWRAHLDNVCLGKGISLDVKNLHTIAQSSLRPWWIRGATITNSVNTRDTLYWNGGAHPGMAITYSSGGDVPINWSDGAHVEFAGVTSTQIAYNSDQPGLVKKWSTADNCVGQVHFNVPFVAHCKETNTGVLFYRAVKNMYSVAYTGAGVGAMRLSRPGLLYLELLVNGAVVQSFILCQNPTSGQYNTVAGLVAAINAYGNGFSAVALDTTYAAVAAGGASSGVVQTLSATPTVQIGMFDFHTEWYHCFHPGGLLENVVIMGNDISSAEYSTAFFNSETGLADTEIVNNSWNGNGNSSSGFGYSHVTVTHNFIVNGLFLFARNVDAYSEMSANLFGSIMAYDNVWPATTPIQDNIWVLNWQGAPTGANYTNNVVTTNFASCVTNVATNDLRPAGDAATHLFAPRFPYDRNFKPRAAVDAAGPLAL